MDPGFVILIVMAVIIVGFMMSAAGGSSSQGLYSGGKKRDFGVIGLTIAIFGILGMASYIQLLL